MIDLELRDRIAELGGDDVIVYDNPSFDRSIIGLSEDDRVIYAWDKMVGELMDDDDMSYEEKPTEIYNPKDVEIVKCDGNYYMDHCDLYNYMHHCAKPTYESAIEDIIEAYEIPELCLDSVIVLIDEETIADMDNRERAIIGNSYVRFEVKNKNDLFNTSLDDSDDIFEYHYQNEPNNNDVDDDLLEENTSHNSNSTYANILLESLNKN